MPRKVVEEGSPFARRRKAVLVNATPDETRKAIASLVDQAQNPWEAHRDDVDWARSQLALERARLGSNYNFKPHDDLGWYFQQLVALDSAVRASIETGDAQWAAQNGAMFGATFAELQLKLHREAGWEWGKARQDETAAASIARRKGTSADRIAAIAELIRQGKSARNAFAIIAKREGSTASAVQKDYYKNRPRTLD